MNLIESTQRNKDDRVRWLAEAERASELVALLPKEIQELEGSADCNSNMELQIKLYGGSEAMRVCEEAGAELDTPHLTGSSASFSTDGKLGDVMIIIIDLPVPPECHVEREEYTAYRYKAICNETGEKV